MKWSDYDGEWLHVEQGKTGAEVNLPVLLLQPLKQVIDIQPKVGPMIFTNLKGQQWIKPNLHQRFDPNRKEAKADNLHWHDQRGYIGILVGRGWLFGNSDRNHHRAFCSI